MCIGLYINARKFIFEQFIIGVDEMKCPFQKNVGNSVRFGAVLILWSGHSVVQDLRFRITLL